MLSFVLTDVAVPRAELQRMLAAAADASFNCMSIDADQSTSDSLVLFSSGRVELPAPTAERDEARAPRRGGAEGTPSLHGWPRGQALAEFEAALKRVCDQLAADVARNGEGTTRVAVWAWGEGLGASPDPSRSPPVRHVLRVAVRGAPSAELARGVGKVSSSRSSSRCEQRLSTARGVNRPSSTRRSSRRPSRATTPTWAASSAPSVPSLAGLRRSSTSGSARWPSAATPSSRGVTRHAPRPGAPLHPQSTAPRTSSARPR